MPVEKFFTVESVSFRNGRDGGLHGVFKLHGTTGPFRFRVKSLKIMTGNEMISLEGEKSWSDIRCSPVSAIIVPDCYGKMNIAPEQLSEALKYPDTICGVGTLVIHDNEIMRLIYCDHGQWKRRFDHHPWNPRKTVRVFFSSGFNDRKYVNSSRNGLNYRPADSRARGDANRR